MKVSYYQIKHNTHNTCIVGVTFKGDKGVQLLRIIPVRGQLPSVEHMLGQVYPSITAISVELYKGYIDKQVLALDDILIAPACMLEFLAKAASLANLCCETAITAELGAHGCITLRYMQEDTLLCEQLVAYQHWAYQQPSVLNMYQKSLSQRIKALPETQSTSYRSNRGLKNEQDPQAL